MSDLKSLAASLPKVDGPEGPQKGAITLDNHGFSMPSAGPLWPPDPVWHFDDCETFMVDYVTDTASAAAAIPSDCTTIPIPDMPGYSMVKVLWNNMRDSSMGPYFECIMAVPVMVGDIPTMYVPFIWVTNDQATAAGREGAGFPKKIADIDLTRYGNQAIAITERGLVPTTRMRISATGQIADKLVSTPIAKGEKVELPYPQNMTLPLPSTENEACTAIPFPTLTWRFFRDVGFDKPAPVMSQLVNAVWQMDGTAYNVTDCSIDLRGVENDPVDMLPVRGVIGGTYVQSDMKLPLAEMTKVVDHFAK